MDTHVDADVVNDTTDASMAEDHDLLVEELLVEEISIDGMCGVY